MVPMSDDRDPDEGFSLEPLGGGEVIKRILDGAGTEEGSEESEDVGDTDS
jgi:hypothetical protein